jgi:hypothetical protein
VLAALRARGVAGHVTGLITRRLTESGHARIVARRGWGHSADRVPGPRRDQRTGVGCRVRPRAGSLVPASSRATLGRAGVSNRRLLARRFGRR